MKIKFNKFERVAGLFVMTAVVGVCAAMMGVAIRRGWFEPKVDLETTFQSADGIHAGTVVQMAGLRAGSVETVELKNNNEILVRFRISRKFHVKVREDSVVRVMRPFIIGEKVLDISVGSDSARLVAENANLPSEESADIMDLLNGRKLGPHLATLGQMMENLRVVAEAFLDPERSKNIVKIFDEMRPLVQNMNAMAKETANLLRKGNKNDQMATALTNLAMLSNELARVLPEFTKNSPELAADLGKIAKNTAILTQEMQVFMPMLTQMAPELPKASARAYEALNETVVTLKALQKSFLLRGSVKEVREEESDARTPASIESAAEEKNVDPKKK
ncbi:MAG: MlaD family protein [Bdellovibrionaceae bacterium]|nr:MlaD family protein [Pseudobdellovibrionaceae bacterium]